MTDNFVHLHAHTSIGSMQDAMSSVDDMFKLAKKYGHTALAITDHGTMAAVFDARMASKKYGVKYIPGLEAYFVDSLDSKEKRKHLVLLAKNENGYRNLLKLNYLGYSNFQYVPIVGKVFPRITWEMLKEYSDGIICLTACASGPLAIEMFQYNEINERNEEGCHLNVLKTASRLKEIFGADMYLELQPHSLKKNLRNRKTGEIVLTPDGDPVVKIDQTYVNRQLLAVSKELDIPVVATCDVHYLTKGDAKSHDMLMAINDKRPVSDKNRHRYEIEEFYMKNRDEVMSYFSDLFNRKIALELCDNTISVSEKCADSDYIDSKDIRFPKFDPSIEDDYGDFLKWKKQQNINGNISEDKAYMRYKCISSFKKVFGHLTGEAKKLYKDRIIEEIKVFEDKNFSSYMLITSDFICKAKERKIRVGPGRGSVGGSLVAHLLGIHEVDPIEYGLLFERFLNKEKTAFPDIDTDFSPDGRNEVEKYIIDKYGKERVAHVSNLSTMTPKVVIKDVARSLELGGDKSAAFKIANEITDSISATAHTFDEALEGSEEFRKFCTKYPEVESYGRKLVGLEKTYATHAAGIVISDIDLSAFVPLRYDKEGTLSIQYEKERCEKVGLIKMDLLGLEHLKVIDNTIENVKSLGFPCKEPSELAPYDDKDVWNMISKGQTICVFQMGSPHMRNLCKRIKPQSIEDLSLVNALGRPSAVKSRETYIMRRDGREKVKFKYECLRPPLKDSLGICVYEEQLAKLAKHAAGWDLNKADGLRKLTKLKGKDPALVAKLKKDFVNDSMVYNKLDSAEALDIWENVIDPFEGYGFNKAHGIFYSLNGYYTAYYKYHYPAAFMAAVLKSEVEKPSSNEEKIKIYKKEAERLGIKIIAPDVNKSGKYFSVLDEKTIAMGLAAVKGVGIKAVENIIETRKEHEFVSFSDFLYRTSSGLVRKNVIQALAKAGCFDSFGVSRKAAFTNFSNLRTKTNKYMENCSSSGNDPWSLVLEHEWVEKEKQTLGCEEWNKKEVLLGEGETLGEYLSGNYNDLFDGFFLNEGVMPLKRLKKMAEGTSVRVEAVVETISQAKTKSGKNKGSSYGSCTLTDVNKDSALMKIWSNKWKAVKDRMSAGKPVRVVCRVNIFNGGHTLVFDRLEAIME